MVVLGFDQSLTGSGCVVLDDHKLVFKETIRTEGLTGMGRVKFIVNEAAKTVEEFNPHIFVMEDYARQARSSSETPLKELGGCIKMMLHDRGFGTSAADVKAGKKVLMIQNQSQMKKFVLGKGSTDKDPRYLLSVFERTKIAFDDDNQADAYMHATMASMVYKAIRGELPIGNLMGYQQEVLLTRALKKTKGLSLAKALKLPEDDKFKLIAA